MRTDLCRIRLECVGLDAIEGSTGSALWGDSRGSTPSGIEFEPCLLFYLQADIANATALLN